VRDEACATPQALWMVAETRGLVQHFGHRPVSVDDAVAAAARASTTP